MYFGRGGEEKGICVYCSGKGDKRPFLRYFAWVYRFIEYSLQTQENTWASCLILEVKSHEKFLLWLKHAFLQWLGIQFLSAKSHLWPSWKMCCHSVSFTPLNVHGFETKSTRSIFVGSYSLPGWHYSSQYKLFVCLMYALFILGHEMMIGLLHPALWKFGMSPCTQFYYKTESQTNPQKWQ